MAGMSQTPCGADAPGFDERQQRMVVGVLSDTHGTLPPEAFRALADMDPDVIVHAGDIGGQEIIDQLEMLAPVKAVLGNNDWRSQYTPPLPERLEFELMGVEFALAHMRSMLPPALPRITIVGHTHKAKVADLGPTTILNPGSTTRPRGGFPPSVARIELDPGYVRSIQIVTLSGERFF